jgi:selenide,water dikinase
VLVGSAAGDDAGVIMLSANTATILTVDVFTPCVDDPYTFGQIAAANSVSDIYAMGGTPQVALSVIGFPIHTLPPAAMHEILRGGADKMAEAGISVIGGHSLNDEEVKCGFAVLGTAPAGAFIRNRGAQVGDAMVLTKPLGTGIAAFAQQIGRASPQLVADMTVSMVALNRLAGSRLHQFQAHAATDVTGFSLLGHLVEIVKNSDVLAEIDVDRLPVLPGVLDLAREDVLPGAVERNREAVEPRLLDLAALAPAQEALLFCPETSGGILAFLPPDRADAFVTELRARGVAQAAIVGRVTDARVGGGIRAVTTRAGECRAAALGTARPEPAAPPPAPGPSSPAPAGKPAAACCSSGAAKPEAEGEPGRERHTPVLSDAFLEYMGTVTAPGAIGLKEKKLMALALSVATRCGPCIRINTEAAVAAGATAQQVDEAAQLGIAFGGAPAAMFYSTLK